MKKKIKLYIFSVLIISECMAQSSDQNYILRVMPTVPVTNLNNLTAEQSIQTVQYYDGLGRPFQTIQKNITPDKKDLVTLNEFDSIGRQYIDWAPVPIAGNDGAFVNIDLFTSSSNGFYGDNKAFQLTEYEPSPLNRVTGRYGLGADWQNQNKKVSTLYELNSASEVSYYFVNSEKKLQRHGYYEANTLYKTITLDEDNKKVTEFTDKQGRVVMVRNAEDVNTYYVYNDLNQKCYVLPPLASDAMTSNITYEDTHDKLAKYGYHYKYDERGNCVEKRFPGCEPIFMVYDNADRLILSQDGNQRAKTPNKQWTVNKYDVFGRLVYTGLMYNNYSRLQLQQVIKDLVIVEEYDGSATLANTGYTCKYFVGEITPILVNYYDDYRFLEKLTANEQSNLAHQDPPPGAYSTQYKDADNQVNAKGLLTGTRTWVLDDVISQYLVSVNYYDYKGQVVQSRSSNHLGGFDIVYNGYDFTGHLTKTHHAQSTQYKSPVVEITTNEYDHANRLKKVKYQIGSYPEITLSEIKYDELGRMIEKKRHDLTDLELFSYNIRNWLKQKTSGTFNEFLYYNGDVPIPGLDTYNGNIAISGIKSGPITKSYAYTYDQLNRLTNGKGYYRTSGAYNPYGYDESFGYDKHGNINSLQRKNASTIIDYLSYTYNGNQISNIFDYTGSQNSYAIKEYNDYNHIYSNDYDFKYDANGNLTVDKDRKIVAIKFNLLNLPDTIQFSNGNQIVNKYAADGRKLGTEFFTQLAALAQPLVEGQVKKQQYSSGFVDQSGIMYINNFEYKTQNGSASLTYLNKVFNAEGYVDEFANSTSYSGFCYYRTDHLGNVCEVWRAAKPGGALAATLQKTFYFPSGLPLSYSTSPGLQPNKYNNKPFIEMHGFDNYDYSARMMYPAVGDRFLSVDPLCEKYYSISPYAYCAGNPVNRIDPDGMDWFQNSQTGAVVYVSNLYQGAEKNMEKGWQWMGENNMFMSDKDDIANSDQILIAKNGGDTQLKGNNPLTHVDDKWVTSMFLEGNSATKFMNERGYDFKPTQQIRYESEINFEQASGSHVITGEKTYITEKSRYIPKGSIENIYTPLNEGRYNLPASVNRFKIEYTTNIIVKGLNFIQPFIGYHDMRIPTVYPSLSAYPRNNTLINKFLRVYPTNTK